MVITASIRGGADMLDRAQLEQEISNVTQSLLSYGPEKVILFGSAARGDVHEGSDLDLLIIKKTSRRFIDRIGDVLAYIESSIPVEPVVYTPEELDRMIEGKNEFVLQALREGRVLFEQ
jgi:predicted nucleotidyltransferase